MATEVQHSGVKVESRDVVRVRMPAPMVLRGVPYELYVALRDLEENDKIRMTYHDGVLELMSPEFLHEFPAQRLNKIVSAVAEIFDMPCLDVGNLTIRRGGKPFKKGHGKEPDCGFYFANAERTFAKKSVDLDAGDPPPDLWIETDNRGSSKGRLPTYAALGVPEVWRYRATRNELWFGRLTNESTYETIDRSLSLPMLTPVLVLEALALGESLLDSPWLTRLRAWIGEKLAKP